MNAVKFLVRYVAYLLFAAAAIALWLHYAVAFLGLSFGDPACAFEPGGCPSPTFVTQLFRMLSVFGAIPLTVFVFVYFRRGLHALLNMNDEGYDR